MLKRLFLFWTRCLALLLVLSLSDIGFSGGTLSQLKDQLARSSDFRVRVQAALKLGKSKHKSVRLCLERALRDKSSAVRASAAAALQIYGDRLAVPALRALSADPSESVQRQAQAAIEALQSARLGAEYLVELGRVRAGRGVQTEELNQTVQRVARRSLRKLPGVVMTADAGDEPDEALPVLVFDGIVERVSEGKKGNLFAVSARVEFVISRMPGRVIKGRIAGAATVHGEHSASKLREQRLQLRREAVAAATESALSHAATALRAASES